MSELIPNVQMAVRHIYVTTGPAVATGHDGKTYTNPDFPVGTIIAEDMNGRWFVRAPGYDTLFDGITPSSFPSRNKDGSVHFFRDYWRFVQFTSDSTAPYAVALFSVPKRLIK